MPASSLLQSPTLRLTAPAPRIGDPIEANAIGQVFSSGRDASRPLIIGSVKTNIGHLEAASGMAGFLKAMLSLKHRTIYSNLHFKQPNPHIPFDALKLRVPVQTESWPDGGAAIAAVNSFGFGGTNAHIVLAESLPEPVPDVPHPAAREPFLYLLPVTGRDETSLRGVIPERFAKGCSTAKPRP